MDKHCRSKQSIKAIILAGSRDLGRYLLVSRLSTALWPVAGRSALEQLLQHLSRQGVKQAVICSNGDGSLLVKHNNSHVVWMAADSRVRELKELRNRFD